MAISDEEALRRLRSTEPTHWLAPTPELSDLARSASRHLFSKLRPYAKKSPLDQLFTEGFDAEQIWHQVEIQSKALVPILRRELKRFEKNPEEIQKLRVHEEEEENVDSDDELDEEDEEEEEEDVEEEDDDVEEEEDEENEEEEIDYDSGAEFEDQFLKIKELEEFMDEDEAREMALDEKDEKAKKKNKVHKQEKSNGDDDDEKDEDEEEADGDEEMGFMGLLDDGDEDDNDELGNARYDDFFGSKDKKPSKRKFNNSGDADGCGSDDETGMILSTHEKERKKLKSKIEKMEQENLGVKDWTMQGEVSAAKRPKNSALEADLQFEHNVTRQPMTTEESTASLEDLIKSRILEGQFDSLQKPAGLTTKAPRKVKELDENKSKKGLAELYEEDYVQKTNVDYVATSFDDEAKKETSIVWKKLCLKLDALSHFHYSPKPVIEDMTLPENVPALVMEEVAPMLVSDAAMLAPQEVFAGKGDIKDETELTKADRKMRRANKKRKYKAEQAKRAANKPRESNLKPKYDDEVAK